MAIQLSEEIKEIFNNPESIKVLATADKEGNPHAVFKGSLHVNDKGYIEYLEFIESSQTNKNMVYSIWFHKSVTVNILLGKKSYQIKGIPYRALIAGQEFEEHYRKVRVERNIDLSTVWLIEPQTVTEQTFEKRRVEEEATHPLLRHLDRLVV